ncbi:MAG: leucine-rich repeat domain-containing protein, partial [Paramuribaculum sp.]|nr:leucine-rich repeat domain-containing protein [Paramuribaculum sp.]
MKKAILFLSTLLMGLIAKGTNDPYYITINGIEYCCSPYENNHRAQLLRGSEAVGDIVIPDSVYLNGVSYAVEIITSSAFRNNDKITRVEIPNTIMDIEDFAFMDCGNLQTVILPSKPRCPGSWIFQGCNLDTMELYQ